LREEIRHGEAAGDEREKNDGEEEAGGMRDSAEERSGEKGHQEPGEGKDSKEAEGAGGEDGNGVADGKTNPYSKGILRADDCERE